MKTTQKVSPEQKSVGGEYTDLEQHAFARGVRDGEVKHYTKAEFRKRFAYSTGGYWVALISRGDNVEGWW